MCDDFGNAELIMLGVLVPLQRKKIVEAMKKLRQTCQKRSSAVDSGQEETHSKQTKQPTDRADPIQKSNKKARALEGGQAPPRKGMHRNNTVPGATKNATRNINSGQVPQPTLGRCYIHAYFI
jgi:hypothetical protein